MHDQRLERTGAYTYPDCDVTPHVLGSGPARPGTRSVDCIWTTSVGRLHMDLHCGLVGQFSSAETLSVAHVGIVSEEQDCQHVPVEVLHSGQAGHRLGGRLLPADAGVQRGFPCKAAQGKLSQEPSALCNVSEHFMFRGLYTG